VNIALIEQTLDYIEENPERWNQAYYGDSDSDTNCFIGMALRLSDTPNISWFYSAQEGARVLDISFDQSMEIAHKYSVETPQELLQLVSDVTGHDFTR
jgi:hypothetical protein